VVVANNLQARIDALRDGDAFRNYERTRDCVLRMKERDAVDSSGVGTPSDYWREELAGFEYMLDASPLLVDKLRHHTYHVTGLRVYDYRTHKDRAHELLAEKLRALIDVGGRELLVPESPLLGGFGFEIDGELYNLDTLKFFEVLIAMDRGALLGQFRDGGDRKLVVEIGAGWGGFAYQFKTLFPDVTYVIVDLPELFLFSGTYLMTAFPDAKIVFYGEDSSDDDDWSDADFILVPNTQLDAVTPPRMDLMLNMVSFQEMTTEQVEAYVAHAHGQECPFLYSLNRERSLYNPELIGVQSIIERYYWPHPVEVLPVSYVKMLDKVPKLAKPKDKLKALTSGKGLDAKQDLDYKHVIGWRRVTT
jgi:hypothetical protein